MKRILAAMAALLLMAMPALAAGEYWTSRQDIYYHRDPSCGSPAYPRVAVSAEAAEEFDRTPCPVCVTAGEADAEPVLPAEEAAPTGLSTVERGGTWVFRVPGAALEGLQMAQETLPEGTEALVDLVGGTLGDEVEARFAVPSDGSMLMSLRVIDGDAYVVTRPKKRYKAKRPFLWRGVQATADIFHPGSFTLDGVSREWEYAPEKKGKPRKVFSDVYTRGMEIEVYSGLDVYIAVISWNGMTDESRLTGVARIGDGAEIPVTGYVEKKASVYCCVLTGAELEALEGGAEPVITPRTPDIDAPDAQPEGDGIPFVEVPADDGPVTLPDLSDDVAGDLEF